MDQQVRLGLDQLELTDLAFEGSPGSDKATYVQSFPSISGGFDLTIQELGIAAPLIPWFVATTVTEMVVSVKK